MKRFAICALGVMVLAGMASAQPDATVWLEWKGNAPGDVEKCVDWGVDPSETAVIQLWMEVHDDGIPASHFVALDAILWADNLATPGVLHHTVSAFNDFGPWGSFGRTDPRGFFSNPPESWPLVMDVMGVDQPNYQFTGDDYTNAGINPGTYLLDEIVLEGGPDPLMTQPGPCPPCDTAVADRIMFAGGVQAPGGFTYWDGFGHYAATIAMLTGSNTKLGVAPLYLCVIPEPASLSLLALGGLAAIRRRR